LNLYTYWLKLNRYYSRAATYQRDGIIVHSTGCNQPKIEPFTNAWNTAASGVCVHGIIGIGPQGFGTYQLIPWDKYVGGCGRGSKGTYNDDHIQFEICEDGLTDRAYFNKVYREAVELCAYLCNLYKLSPSTIVCHSEACALGYASNHADVMHWFPRFGKTMDDFRADVKKILTGEDDENMVRYAYLKDIPDDWGAQTMVDKLMTAGIIKGDGSDKTGNKDKIDLSADMVRMLAFNYAAGLYDTALQAVGLAR